MSSEGGSFGHVSFHVGTDWRVDCHTYGERTPILSVDAGPASVSFTITDRNADKAAVQFAQALAREAQAFAVEIERLHAIQLAGTVDGEEDSAKAADINAA